MPVQQTNLLFRREPTRCLVYPANPAHRSIHNLGPVLYRGLYGKALVDAMVSMYISRRIPVAVAIQHPDGRNDVQIHRVVKRRS